MLSEFTQVVWPYNSSPWQLLGWSAGKGKKPRLLSLASILENYPSLRVLLLPSESAAPVYPCYPGPALPAWGYLDLQGCPSPQLLLKRQGLQPTVLGTFQCMIMVAAVIADSAQTALHSTPLVLSCAFCCWLHLQMRGLRNS